MSPGSMPAGAPPVTRLLAQEPPMAALHRPLLLDTHALLWWWADDARLPAAVRMLIADRSRTVLVSAVSGLEVTTKFRLGKLPGCEEAADRFATLVRRSGFDALPVSLEHALVAGRFAQEHRDPFDRLLAAQAQVDQLVLVTRDPAFIDFGVSTVW